MVAGDGTEYFRSQKRNRPRRQTRKRGNGKVESHHSMPAATVVAPGHASVVPLMPEFIAKPDGADKQDCERNAVNRWFAKRGERLSPRRPVYLGDDLFARQPIARMVTDNGGDFIFSCKESSRKALSDLIARAERDRHAQKIRKGETRRFRFIEAAPRRDGKDAPPVNWIGFEILAAKGAIKYKTAFVSSLPVSTSNVAEIIACGRARRKSENESFNVMKNHGDEFEHDFGHGERFLAMTPAALNRLAFA